MDRGDAEARFVTAMAAGITDPEHVEAHAGEAASALRTVLTGRRSLVLEVRFTGFYQEGRLVGPVDPSITQAAARLIVLRVDRIGFTADAGDEDIRTVLGEITHGTTAEGRGIIERITDAAPRGVYLGSSTGGVYRPEPRSDTASPVSPAEDTAGEREGKPPPTPEEEPPDAAPSLDALELLDEPLRGPVTPTAPDSGASAERPGDPQSKKPAGKERAGSGSEGLFEFFRSTDPTETTASEDELAEELAAARDLPEYDALCQAAEVAIREWAKEGQTVRMLSVVIALGEEATRRDRTRIYRETAGKALRASLDRDALRSLIEIAETAAQDRRRKLLTAFIVIGRRGEEFLLRSMIRSRDAATRADILHALRSAGRSVTEILDHALESGGPIALSRMVAAAREHAEDDLREALLWLQGLVDHENSRIRHQVAASIAGFDDPIRIRVLLRLMEDESAEVRQAAIEALGDAGDPAAVPFLVRVAGDEDDEIAIAAIASLGRLKAAESVGPLERIVGSRSWFGKERRRTRKYAAVRALGRIGTPRAIEAVRAASRSRDKHLASEAGEVLQRYDAGDGGTIE